MESADDTRTRLLDAACDQFSRYGIQRTSMDRIARVAKCSRITIYRKFRTKDELVDAVLHRELAIYFDRFLDDVAKGRTAADRLVLGFVGSIRAFRGHPLAAQLLESEPDLLVQAVNGDGTMLAGVRGFVANQLRREQKSGNISADLDADLTAEILARTAVSFVTIPSHLVDIDDATQLETIARRYLAPMLGPTATIEAAD